MPTAVLLVNLGTPASTSRRDVRSYLREFLTDPSVIDLPTPWRQILVNGLILPFRPRRSAAAYTKVWDAGGPDTGSPLLHFTREQCAALSRALAPLPCEFAMRYGSPAIREGIEALLARGADHLHLVPLYPQHADSTRETSIKEALRHLPPNVQLTVQPPFYAAPDYLKVQADLIQAHLPDRWDHLLLSYHGLPERHLTTADPTGNHCLKQPDCCETASPAHATCYRHQVMVTSAALRQALNVDSQRCTVSFQSRLGRLPWLEPYTDATLAALPGRGVQDLVVACPAFVADNLETLEEIGMAGRETFLSAGGNSFTLIPCLNAEPAWIQVLADWCRASQTSLARSETA